MVFVVVGGGGLGGVQNFFDGYWDVFGQWVGVVLEFILFVFCVCWVVMCMKNLIDCFVGLDCLFVVGGEYDGQLLVG